MNSRAPASRIWARVLAAAAARSGDRYERRAVGVPTGSASGLTCSVIGITITAMDAPTTHRIEEEETMPTLTGVRAVKLPVKDLPSSVQWYREVFGYRPTVEFPDANGVVVGVAGELPGSTTGLSLRANPEAHSMVGLEVMISVADRAALEPW